MLSHFSHIRLFATPWTVACQASLSVGFSRQEHWSGYWSTPSLLQGIFLTQGSNPSFLSLSRRILYHWAAWDTQGTLKYLANDLNPTCFYQDERTPFIKIPEEKKQAQVFWQTLHCPGRGTVPSPHTLRPRRAAVIHSISGASDLGIS